jgi:hypothetical protein
VTRGKRLYVACLILLLTQISTLKSSAQSVLLSSIDREDDLYNHDRNATMVASPPAEESKTSTRSVSPGFVPDPISLSSRDPGKFGLVELAYLDVYTILKSNNQCSSLFGGPFAISALNELVRNLKPRYLDKKIAIRMSGETTTVQSQMTGFLYRSFERVEVNLSGSFYRVNSRSTIVQEFPPNTRETRVVVLLHELGHMVKNSKNQWVLPDDGADTSLSTQNSLTVVSACRDEIKGLSRMSHAQEFELMAKKETLQ